VACRGWFLQWLKFAGLGFYILRGPYLNELLVLRCDLAVPYKKLKGCPTLIFNVRQNRPNSVKIELFKLNLSTNWQ
jgi:hypothetical protein